MSTPRPYRFPAPAQASGSATYQAVHDLSPPTSPGSSPRSSIDGHNVSDTMRLVAKGGLGAGYTPYPTAPETVADLQRNSTTRYSAVLPNDSSRHEHSALLAVGAMAMPGTNSMPSQLDLMPKDEALDPDEELAQPVTLRDRVRTIFSSRGYMNLCVLITIVVGIICLFVVYPVVHAVMHPSDEEGFQLTNSTGQISGIPGMRSVVDIDTPDDVKHRQGADGKLYHLVFSDEFTVDGRSFGDGDDPYWEAVDLHYWPTDDLEWYDPGQITTEGGKLVITIDKRQNHDLNYISGMLQSWNKFCFTNGYIEVSVSLPGTPSVSGFWPAAWTMGNLGRAGFGATTEGLWPYSYTACDVGTLPNQTMPGGAALLKQDGTPLSFLPGQRLSACACEGADHPGPRYDVPRNAPEIDILEATVQVARAQGVASQSLQLAPFNALYEYNNTPPATVIDDPAVTKLNTYLGAEYQQAMSALTDFDSTAYGGTKFNTYAYEYHSGADDGYITWFVNGQQTWTLNAAALAGDTTSGISARVVSEEPMYIILNLGMAENFQTVDAANLQFPSKMYVDYVRVYQRDGEDNIGCEPDGFPTQDYINRHMNAYTNPNATTWAQAGYTFPKNSKVDQC